MVSEPVGSLDVDRRRDLVVKRLVLVVGAVIFIDTMLYAVISPMLPQLSHQLGLSKLSAGILAASYPAGMLLASLPGGALAVRIGPRLTVCVGLGLLVASTIGFAFLNTAAGLDLARMVEGIGGACTWAGGLAWVSAATSPDRRGEMVGKVLGAAIGGAVFGPAIGAIASAAGRSVLFSGLSLAGLGLVVLTLQLPDESEPSEQGLGFVFRVMVRPAVLIGAWLVALPAIASGMTGVLGALRLHHFGASAAVIGGTFLVGTAIEAVVSPVVGSLSDRVGRMLPMRIGIVAVAVMTVAYMLPTSVPAIALLIVLLILSLGLFWAPSMALLADAADATGLDQAHAAALMNLAWAAGQIIGSAGGGAGAKSFGDLPVAIVVAAICAATLAVVSLRPQLAGGGARAARASAGLPGG